MVVLDGPDQIGMARAWTGDDFFRDRGSRLRGHDLFPVLPVPIGDMQGDGGAEGDTFADAREELDAVLLDAHAASTAVAFLASGEVAIDVVGGEGQARGHPFQDGDQTLPVGFSPVQVPEHEGIVLTLLLNDGRGNEDQQLRLVNRYTLVLKQPAEEGDAVEPWNALDRVVASFFKDPAQDRRLA